MELRQQDLGGRQWVIGAMVFGVGVVFIVRLFHMQVSTNQWTEMAEQLTEERVIVQPTRGLCLDRNGAVLITNAASYDLMVVPRDMEGVDLEELSKFLQLDLETLKSKMDKAKSFSTILSSPLLRQLDAREYARLSPELWRYPGLTIESRLIRQNVHGIASQVLGEYREVDRADMNRDARYRLGDYKGKSGIEYQFENELRGETGMKHYLVDVLNAQRTALEHRDVIPKRGQDITLTLDLELQQYAEALMKGKRGAIVAIEPRTGEILAFVSAPSYDGNLLTGTSRGAAYDSLSRHPWKPLYNRAVRGTYRPGSIFKMVQGLIAMQDGEISDRTHIMCNRSIIGCHGAHSQDDLRNAIVHSCNPYFYEVMRRVIHRDPELDNFDNARLGLGWWSEQVQSFGFGTNLGGHIPGTNSGLVPDTAYYDNIYGKRHWTYRTIYSISIGEGELLTTPLHMANLAAIVANRGWYLEPHMVRDVGGQGKPGAFQVKHEVNVDRSHFEPILDAMQSVIEDQTGTGRMAYTEGIVMCGKTGTVQNPNDADHSVFIALAPRDEPQIALSVYVENAGSGGKWAAPIAGLLVEKYLHGSIEGIDRETRILGATYPLDEQYAASVTLEQNPTP